MGRLETISRKKTRRKNIQKIILATVAAAGFLGLAMLTPNVLRVMPKPIFRDRRRDLIKRAERRLIENGSLTYKDNRLKITALGEAKLRQLELDDFKFKKPKRWDKKWRVLIFDIPERQRRTRGKIRKTLQQIGFIKLQQSVWVYPYDCEDLIALLKLDFRVGKNLLYLIVEAIENDTWLKEQFELK